MEDDICFNDVINSSVYYCKTAKFHESGSEETPFSKLTLLRRITNQLGNLSYLIADNQVSCDILNENLKQYCGLLDDKNGVNNYAASVHALVKYFKNAQCQKWKSGLLTNDDSKKIGQEMPLTIPSVACKGCHESEENLDIFQKLLKNLDKSQPSFISSSNSVVSKELSSESCHSVLKSSSVFSQKRKNAFLIDDQSDTSKSRKLEKSGTFDDFSRLDKAPLVNSSVNRFNTVTEESPRSNQSNSKPLFNFRTASAELRAQQMKKHGNNKNNENTGDTGYQPIKKSLGSRPRPVTSKFVVPVKSNNKNEMSYDDNGGDSKQNSEEELDPRLQHIDPKMIEMIRSEIMDSSNPLTWDDIAGLQYAKNTIQEIVVWPMLRPDIFTGLRRPPKGILLFGPPGTGKTLIAKCIASQSKSTFFSISASSLTSKWIGDGEKMVRALFAVARVDQPSVVFIDEIDSLLSRRSDTEHESSRRIKTEFLVQLDGATTGEEDRLLIVGATNRPHELDEAARRRLVKRLYIPLPEHQARVEMITRLMSKERNILSSDQINELADLTDGYSGADVKILCQEAALGPIRSISYSQIEHITTEQVRPVTMDDFKTALTRVRSSVSPDDLKCYIDWDKTYGSGSI